MFQNGQDQLHVLLHAGKAKYASGEVYMGHWQRGKRHGQGKWSSAPKTAPAAPVTAAAAATGSSSGRSSSRKASKEVQEVYVGSWVAGKREGHGVAEYVDGGRCVTGVLSIDP